MKQIYKLCVIAPHLVQYHAPLFKEIARLDSLDVTIIYLDKIGFEEFRDTEFNHNIKWDESLLEGYKYKLLKNYSIKRLSGFFSRINPGIFKELLLNKYDVVLIPGYATLSYWFVLIAAKLTKTKIIWRGEATLRGDENSNYPMILLKRVIIPVYLSLCDAVLYSCKGNKEYLKFYGVSEEISMFAPCSVDNEFFQKKRTDISDREKDKTRNELGINDTDLVLLFCARFTKRKRPVDLLTAVGRIENKNITVIFVGDGPEKKNMEIYAKKNNIRASFVGFKDQSELPYYYSIAHVAIIVSDYDPSPKVINEVMNFGLSLIVTDVVGTAYDLVEDGKNGFIVKTGDIDSIAEKIAYINKERHLLKKMGEHSLNTVNDWSLKKSAAAVEKAVKMVMGNHEL